METINFYAQTDDYGYYSNFSHHSVKIDGKVWPTTEHYYQAMKFDDEAYQEEIRQADRPGKAKRLGNVRHPSFKTNWKDIMDDVMFTAVYAKFTQHHDLQQKLLTDGGGDALLVEHTYNDTYWGDGGDGSGKNMLGITLMRVRNQIRFDNILE